MKERIIFLKNKLSHKFQFLIFLSKRIKNDEIDVLSSSLSYTTLMSLIPVLAVLLSVFSLFPSFQKLRTEMMHFIITNMMPQSGEVLQEYIDSFVSNASQTTMLGLATLVVISLCLIRRIDITLNRIWHTTSTRPRITTFALYWTVLTLGPILLGLSIAITSSITAAQMLGNINMDTLNIINRIVVNIVPALLVFTILFIVYTGVPNTKVNFLYAAIGAFLAAVMQDFLRRAFTYYITNFSNYTLIYGAVAALPILMVWTYINWYIVLLGAELAAVMQDYKLTHPKPTKALKDSEAKNQAPSSDIEKTSPKNE